VAEGAYLLARWRWYRRLRGGHWERWWVTERHSFRWALMPGGCANHLREGAAAKPEGVIGTPACETWS
jgi:hypothetical protein